MSVRFIALFLLVLAFALPTAASARKTVCSITVNSADERDLFRQRLPAEDFDFVELVERGRPDWLASACRKGVQCDVLLVSGHFDGGTDFYSDRLDVRESLSVAELERASCSDSCPGLFAQLKEVYLFGCNTLNAEAMRSASAEIGRSLLRAGHSPADAERVTRLLAEQNAESNRDRMRGIFKDVPVIYGFSSKAPLGPYAASTLDRYFKSGVSEVGSGRASTRLVGLFAPVSMTVTAGLTDADPNSQHRAEVCRFSDDRLDAAGKLDFVHALLGRDMAEVRMFLDHIERYTSSIGPAERADPAVARALAAIASDQPARGRYLEFARDADEPAVRARMLELAGTLGWLTPDQHRAELLRMIGDELARNAVSAAEVDLACALNKDEMLANGLQQLALGPVRQPRNVPGSALLACLGSAEARAEVLRALTSTDDEDVKIAQVYLAHRPIADAAELRGVTTGIVQMTKTDAQVRALDTLARNPSFDRASLDELAQLYPRTRSAGVQRAIAGILIRSDYQAMPRAELLATLRTHRVKSADGVDTIDVLIRRLQAQ